ncbi:MAG: leucyl/phenylalanyl-tRNA--protein transferase [Pseudohongiellaceae bacterium]
MPKPLPWLDPEVVEFPPVETALPSPNGLLAAGGDLTPDWLLTAYRQGIFPWFDERQPILWWAPDPRLVLYPGQMHISRSLKRLARKTSYRITADTSFAAVVDACAETTDLARPGTWITRDMKAAFQILHELGYAHSVEVWQDKDLVGGLYGLALGKVFFGESMFSLEPNTSKLALWCLERQLAAWGYGLIDCQVSSRHLISLGAETIPRRRFQELLTQMLGDDGTNNADGSNNTGQWQLDVSLMFNENEPDTT